MLGSAGARCVPPRGASPAAISAVDPLADKWIRGMAPRCPRIRSHSDARGAVRFGTPLGLTLRQEPPGCCPAWQPESATMQNATLMLDDIITETLLLGTQRQLQQTEPHLSVLARVRRAEALVDEMLPEERADYFAGSPARRGLRAPAPSGRRHHDEEPQGFSRATLLERQAATPAPALRQGTRLRLRARTPQPSSLAVE